MLTPNQAHTGWSALSAVLGVGYFALWSVSFYPQLILNYQRKSTSGLSPDFIILNPLGFLFLTIYNFSLVLSPLARAQYAARHAGHAPSVSYADLAFALHALLISTLTLLQVVYYNLPPEAHSRLRRLLRPANERERERERLLPLSPPLPAAAADGSKVLGLAVPRGPMSPTVLGQVALLGIAGTAGVSAVLVWIGRMEWLDWLYVASAIKLGISIVKYIPQVVLNTRLKSADGFAIEAILCDIAGAVLSFAQLVVESVFIARYPAGIVANPAKLGLAALSLGFDVVFVLQRYVFYKDRRIVEEESSAAVDAGRGVGEIDV